MRNANDELKEYNCSDIYYKYNFLVITDGIKALCETFSCWWLMDLIASYQPQLKNKEPFQVWSMGKNEDSSAIVLATDGNDRIIASQNIPWTDFEADVCTVWVEGGVALLPSEH